MSDLNSSCRSRCSRCPVERVEEPRLHDRHRPPWESSAAGRLVTARVRRHHDGGRRRPALAPSSGTSRSTLDQAWREKLSLLASAPGTPVATSKLTSGQSRRIRVLLRGLRAAPPARVGVCAPGRARVGVCRRRPAVDGGGMMFVDAVLLKPWKVDDDGERRRGVEARRHVDQRARGGAWSGGRRAPPSRVRRPRCR